MSFVRERKDRKGTHSNSNLFCPRQSEEMLKDVVDEILNSALVNDWISEGSSSNSKCLSAKGLRLVSERGRKTS